MTVSPTRDGWATFDLGAFLPDMRYPTDHTLGVHIDVSHLAATPPGFDVTVTCTLQAIDKRRLTWSVSAHDGEDLIGEGAHMRAVIDRARFDERVLAKGARIRKA